MRTPPVGVLLLVFIGKQRFKGTTMQIEGHHIGGGECVLRETGKKEFIDQARAGEAHAALLSVRRMGRHHHAAPLPIGSHCNIWAVINADV
jgi:hypothetical protein